MKLKEIVSVKRGLVARGEQEGDVRYLRIGDFDEQGQLQESNACYLSSDPDEKYILQPGDILMSITASRFFAVEFPAEEGKFAPNHYFNILRMKSDRFTTEQLVNFLNSEKVHKQLEDLTEGETIRTVPTKNLGELRVRI